MSTLRAHPANRWIAHEVKLNLQTIVSNLGKNYGRVHCQYTLKEFANRTLRN